jgi:nocardicin N-oxygenase
MKPSDFPRDGKFRDPLTRPFRDDHGIFHVFSYADVMRVIRDDGTTFTRDPRLWLQLGPGPHSPVLDFLWATEPLTPDGAAGRHDVLRGVTESWFRTRAVRKMEPVVREITAQLLCDLVAEGSGDFNLADLAPRLSLRVICRLTGIELEREEWLREKLEEVKNARSFVELPLQWDLQAYFWRLIAACLAHPGEELLDALATAWRDGDISDDELIGYVTGFFVAGADTTAANLVNALALPAEFGYLDYARGILDDREALRGLVEEIVRFGTPFASKMFSVLRDSQFGEFSVPAGSTLCAWLAAANRDQAINGERGQASAGSFDPRRRSNHHVGFGVGRHACLGADLGRLEMQVLIQETLARLPGLHLSEEKPFTRRAGIVHEVSEAWFAYDADQARDLAASHA